MQLSNSIRAKSITNLSARMLNAVRNNFVGETGMLRQNFGSALSMSFLRLSALVPSMVPPGPPVADEDVPVLDDDDACFWYKINMARATR